MKKSFYTVLVPFLSVLFMMAAAAFSTAGTGTTYVGAAVPLSPTNWTTPLDVSNTVLYDNGPEIAASPLNGAVTISWEQRDIGQYPTFNQIPHASNSTLGGPFILQNLQRSGFKLSGAVDVAHDSLGRRHIIWYHNSGTGYSTVCGYYSVVGTNGLSSPPVQIPGTCGNNRKMSSIAIGPDNSVHVVFGWIGNNMHYWQMSPNGAWVVQEELIPEALGARVYPESPSIAVSTAGVVMVAWKDLSPSGSGSDIFTAQRNGTNQWTVEDISHACCSGCPTTSGAYTPSLAADRTGGFRLAWGDERCPRGSVRGIDLYHRTWVVGTGWANQPLVRVFQSNGEAYDMGVAVDEGNRSHIVWSDDTGRPYKNTTIYYSSGAGTTFTSPSSPFENWHGLAYAKEPSIDYAFGHLHVSFSSIRDESNKDNYYARLSIAPPVTNTPTATATPRCVDRFRDVCPGDTFYTNIINLVNLGVISGYADGTFRPNANLTRGQAAKMVVLAANLPANLQGAPHFTDVPSTHTFYEFVEYSYNAGILSGYACGGPGEPCDTQRRAYFRPGNNVTRGQLSKMTAEAFDFNEPVSGQTFTDVPPTNSFYLFIERMARRGIIGGYTDGTFRPNADVTRGQACKILDGARLEVATATPMATETAAYTPTSTAIAPTQTVMSTATLQPTLTATIEPTLTTTVAVPTITVTISGVSR